jgi:hypothetical protein
MKSTAKRLSEVYCVLKSDEDAITVFSVDCAYLMHYPETWGKGDKVMVTDGMLVVWYNSTRTEIPVSHFMDLLRDTIAPWRLLEDAKERGGDPRSWGIIYVNQHHIIEITKDMKVVLNGRPMKGITSYTELLTLIRLIG